MHGRVAPQKALRLRSTSYGWLIGSWVNELSDDIGDACSTGKKRVRSCDGQKMIDQKHEATEGENKKMKVPVGSGPYNLMIE